MFVILHRNELFKKNVVQVIFDAATQLVKTFIFKAGHRAAAMFKNKAQFTMADLLKTTKEDVKVYVSVEKLITLCENHYILAPLPVTKKRKEITYFMPSILRSATEDELKNVPVTTEVSPLMYRYECGYLPVGVFSSLITGLVSNIKLNWTFKEDSPCHNKIEFLVGKDLDTVTIISYATYYIKVVLYRESHPKTPTPVVCAHIRNTITSTLTQVNHNLKSRLQYGFECTDHPPEELSHSESHHLCILEDETSHKMMCLKDPNITKIIPLIARQTIWFPKVCL